jgi:hypothetical protein
MKVGDYVRIKNSGINKITSILNNEIRFDEKPIFSDGECIGYKWCYKEDVIKSSPNIIDLIEVGDYVNGCLVTNKRASVNERLSGHPKQIFILKQEGNYYDGHFEWLGEEDIKSIVTKEQFEAMEYKCE